MGHGINDQVNASDCRRHGFRAVEVHDGGAARAITSPHAPDDAPAGVLERPHESAAKDAVRPDHQHSAGSGSRRHQRSTPKRPSSPDMHASEVAPAGDDVTSTP